MSDPQQNGNHASPKEEITVQNSYFTNAAAQPKNSKRSLPLWFSSEFNAKDLKNLFKCSVAA
jgi:hypothetical protein